MFELDNRGGALGDVSYLTPEAFAYNVPCYWRFTVHGSEGLAETSEKADCVTVWRADNPAVGRLSGPGRKGGYLQDFLDEIARRPPADGALRTPDVLSASRTALLAQKAADENLHDLPIPTQIPR